MSTAVYAEYLTRSDDRASHGSMANPESLLERMQETLRVKRIERETVRLLQAMSDHQLTDLGVERREIRDVARKTAANPGIRYHDLVDRAA